MSSVLYAHDPFHKPPQKGSLTSDEQEARGEFQHAVIYPYNDSNELVGFSQTDPPGTCWDHDEKKRVFRVTDPDGKATEYREGEWGVAGGDRRWAVSSGR